MPALRRLLLLLCLVAPGCAGTAPESSTDDLVTVEGLVTVRGNMPFARLVLETDAHNLYLLVLPDPQRRALQEDLPGRYRVRGTVSLGDWDGRPFAQIAPFSLERL